MTTIPIQDTNLFAIDSLRFPLDSSMRIIFTGYYNGFGVKVESAEEQALLYHMGCFGKGSASRSKPRVSSTDGSTCIMRKRQFLKRNFWYKKFGDTNSSTEADTFLKAIEELSCKITNDTLNRQGRDIIDLVSSEEENNDDNDLITSQINLMHFDKKENTVVIVPNSDSEDENYFANLKPKCCINNIKLEENLMLTLQEAFFLMYGLGCLRIVNEDKVLSIEGAWELFMDTEKDYFPKYVVYHYFRSKGYIVKPGIKFGGDYLLYKEGPGVNHADYIVVIKSESVEDWISILGHIRMANTTVKEILVAEILKPVEEPQKFPEDLKLYKIRETILSRNIPVTINNDYE